MALFSVMRSIPHMPSRTGHELPGFIDEAQAATARALTRFFERHRHQLSVEPETAAAAFRSLLFGSGHPIINPHRMALPEIISILHNGIGARKEAIT